MIARILLVFLLALNLQVPQAGAEDGGQWWASKAQRLTTGNGISSAVSLWRAPESRRAELRVLVIRQRDAVGATAAWLKVDGEMKLLTCSRVEASFLRTPGFRSCFSHFPGVERANTVSRCLLDWEIADEILAGASVELQIDTGIKLLKRKRLSKRQLDKLTTLRPMS